MTIKADKSRAPDGSAGYFDPESIERRRLVPGADARLIWGERIMMGIIDFEPGTVVPRHSHPHEQCGRVLEGSAWFELEGHEKVLLVAGDHYVIPGHVSHQVTATDEGCVVLDIWSPIREEYISDDIGFFGGD
jgi:quercetin dioxygenase-like cupin family protein